MNEIFNFQVILTQVFWKKIGQIPIGIEMDGEDGGIHFLFFGESGMESSLLRYFFGVFLVT